MWGNRPVLCAPACTHTHSHTHDITLERVVIRVVNFRRLPWGAGLSSGPNKERELTNEVEYYPCLEESGRYDLEDGKGTDIVEYFRLSELLSPEGMGLQCSNKGRPQWVFLKWVSEYSGSQKVGSCWQVRDFFLHLSVRSFWNESYRCAQCQPAGIMLENSI